MPGFYLYNGENIKFHIAGGIKFSTNTFINKKSFSTDTIVDHPMDGPTTETNTEFFDFYNDEFANLIYKADKTLIYPAIELSIDSEIFDFVFSYNPNFKLINQKTDFIDFWVLSLRIGITKKRNKHDLYIHKLQNID